MELLQELQELKRVIGAQHKCRAEVRTAVRECKEALANREIQLVMQGAGTKGSNTEARKKHLQSVLNGDEAYQDYLSMLRELQSDLDNAEAVVKTTTMQASILTASATLQAALISANLIDDSANLNGLI